MDVWVLLKRLLHKAHSSGFERRSFHTTRRHYRVRGLFLLTQGVGKGYHRPLKKSHTEPQRALALGGLLRRVSIMLGYNRNNTE